MKELGKPYTLIEFVENLRTQEEIVGDATFGHRPKARGLLEPERRPFIRPSLLSQAKDIMRSHAKTHEDPRSLRFWTGSGEGEAMRRVAKRSFLGCCAVGSEDQGGSMKTSEGGPGAKRARLWSTMRCKNTILSLEYSRNIVVGGHYSVNHGSWLVNRHL